MNVEKGAAGPKISREAKKTRYLDEPLSEEWYGKQPHQIYESELAR